MKPLPSLLNNNNFLKKIRTSLSDIFSITLWKCKFFVFYLCREHENLISYDYHQYWHNLGILELTYVQSMHSEDLICLSLKKYLPMVVWAFEGQSNPKFLDRKPPFGQSDCKCWVWKSLDLWSKFTIWWELVFSQSWIRRQDCCNSFWDHKGKLSWRIGLATLLYIDTALRNMRLFWKKALRFVLS